MYLLPNKPPDPNEPRDCAHDTTSRDYQSFNELDGTLSIHTVCDACCETLGVRGLKLGVLKGDERVTRSFNTGGRVA